MKTLWDLVKRAECPDLAVTGLAKNTGKTVTFNYLVNAARRDGIITGLTSIGRDGEMWDILTFKQKPPIKVSTGVLLATAEKTLSVSTARLTLLERTGLDTPLGEVVLARAESDGTVELAGPSKVKELIAVKERLKDAGAEMVLVDGALDRHSLAAPHVTGACVLATGAVLDDSLDQVIRITRDRVRYFLFDAAPEKISRYYLPGHVVIINNMEPMTYSNHFILTRGENFWRGLGSLSAVLFGGSLVQSTLEGIVGSGLDLKGLTLVVKDVTRLFAEGAAVDKFLSSGGEIKAINPINLLALTVNPTSPHSRGFNALEFYKKISEAISEVPVFDLIRGLGPGVSFGR